MITNVNYSIFPSDEMLTFGKSTISLVTARKNDINGLVSFVTNVEEKCLRFQSALERELKNPLTSRQHAIDVERSDAFISLRSYTESSALRKREGWASAAEQVLSVLRKHGWGTHRMGYKAKSAAINNIVSELRTRYSNELALINATELVDELEAAQQNFESIAAQHVELASANNDPTVNETRPELIAALRALFQFVGLQQIAAPSAEVDQLIATLNEHITKSLSTVRASETRSENAKKINDSSSNKTQN